jgi:hypothetical protein
MGDDGGKGSGQKPKAEDAKMLARLRSAARRDRQARAASAERARKLFEQKQAEQ